MPPKSKKQTTKYSAKVFAATPIGPRGCTVTARERDGTGKAYLHWSKDGKAYKKALDINLYNSHGQLDPEAQGKVNAEQRRVLECLLAGTDPYPPTATTAASTPPQRRSGLTLDEAFSRYCDRYGPVATIGGAQERRYRRVHQSVLLLWGPAKLASEVTVADLQTYACWRREAICASSSDPSVTGARQAEIEVSCIASVLRWLAGSCGATDVQPIKAEPIKRALRAHQEPARPRFTDDEASRIEQALEGEDPRLVLLITIQHAQRAGQVLRLKRSRVRIERGVAGNVTGIELDVLGKWKKETEPYYLTPEAVLTMVAALESGYLRDLEAEYEAAGTDYPIFPGGIRYLEPGEAAPVGVQRPLNRRTALKWFEALEAKAGVTHIRGRGFHGFRRRAVDVLLKNGATPAQIQAAGGWASIQIPMEIYSAGISDADRRQAAALLAKDPRKQVTASEAAASPNPTAEVSYPETDPDLAQLLKAKNLTDAEVDEVLKLAEWAWVELNYRPHAYQGPTSRLSIRSPAANSLQIAQPAGRCQQRCRSLPGSTDTLTDTPQCPIVRIPIAGAPPPPLYAGSTEWLPSPWRCRSQRIRADRTGRPCVALLPLLGLNQDSPDPESVPLGQRFRSTCPETVTYRASVPASPPQNARICPEKR